MFITSTRSAARAPLICAKNVALQNRVDPFGALCAVNARGALMGNRGGRIHRDDQTLGSRRHASRQWIACVCQFRNRQRKVWGAGYTELFFLDEVTALAAGHRPCFECRREEAKDFAALFPFAPGEAAKADRMDVQLHAERLDGRKKRMFEADAASLPDGAMFARDGIAYAVRNGNHLRWSHEGYALAATIAGPVDVLTPPAIVAVLQRGYSPRWASAACHSY